MRRRAFVLFVSAGIVALAMSVLRAAPPEAPARPQALAQAPARTDDATRYAGVVTQYCASCHNSRVSTAATASGVVFDTVDLHRIDNDVAMWERVVRKLRAGAMPPQGAPHPDATTQQELLSWLEGRLDAAAAMPN